MVLAIRTFFVHVIVIVMTFAYQDAIAGNPEHMASLVGRALPKDAKKPYLVDIPATANPVIQGRELHRFLVPSTCLRATLAIGTEGDENSLKVIINAFSDVPENSLAACSFVIIANDADRPAIEELVKRTGAAVFYVAYEPPV